MSKLLRDKEMLEVKKVSLKQAEMIDNLKVMGLLDPPSTKLTHGPDILKKERSGISKSFSEMIENYPLKINNIFS